MKKCFYKLASAALTATLLLGLMNSTQAGVLKLLKGEPASTCACDHFQKVAFVGEAQVLQVVGDVKHLTGVDQWSPLLPGAKLLPGAMLKTAEGSRAILRMTISGSLVSVTPQTILRLVPFDEGMSHSSVTGEETAKGFVVRALRGSGEYLSNGRWNPIQLTSDIPPGSKVRLHSGKEIDFYSRSIGSFRLASKGEAVLPKEPIAGTRILSAPKPFLAINSSP